MLQKEFAKNINQTNLFLGKKTKCFKKSPSKKKKAKTPMKDQSEDTSMVSTKDFFSAFSDYTTFEEGNDYSPVYHESLFVQSIFSNDQHDSGLDGKGIINDTYYNNYDSSMFSHNYEKKASNISEQDEEIDCQIINFPAISGDDYEDLSNDLMSSYPTNIDILPKTEKTKESSSIKFIVTKKGRKKHSTSNSINKKLPPTLKCGHENCSNCFYTIKQRAIHHKKLSPLCTNDTITLIKLIGNTKKVLYNAYHYQKGNISPLKSIKNKYDAFIHSFTFKDYFQYIAGKTFEDCMTIDDENEVRDDTLI